MQREHVWPYVVGLAGFTALATFAVVATEPEQWLPALTPLAALVALWFARSRLQIAPLSPTWLISLVVGGVGSVGYLLAAQLTGVGGGGAILSLPVDDRVETASIFAVSNAAFAIGAILTLVSMPRPTKSRLSAVVVGPRVRIWMLVVAVLPLAMILVSAGTTLFVRENYLIGGPLQALFGLGQQLGTATIALIGFVVAASKGGQRVTGLVIAAAYLAVFFSLGSRRLALLPLIFVIGMLMAKPVKVWVKLVVAGTLALIFLPLPLFLRSGQEHGFVLYFERLDGFSFENVDWLTTLNNVLVSFPITGMSALHVQDLPLHYLWISLNPMPGQSAGWYDISGSLRLNAFTPYSSLGELWNYGPWVAAAIWAFFGVISAFLDRAVGRLWEHRLAFVALAVVGLSALFALQALQYNLRASSRLLMYAVVLASVALILVRVRESRDVARAEQLRRRASLRNSVSLAESNNGGS